jgi:hypothetical protein
MGKIGKQTNDKIRGGEGGGECQNLCNFCICNLSSSAKAPFGLKMINPSINIRDEGRKNNVKSLWKAFNK